VREKNAQLLQQSRLSRWCLLQRSSHFVTEASKSFVMPTIIRPNRLQSIPTASVSSSTHLQELAKVKTIPMTPKRSQVMDIFDLNDDDDDADDSIDSIKLQSADYSPPEPNIPPPALPSSLSVSPSKDFFASKRDACRQQAIATALFDYASCHSGDLNFSAGDRITLKKRVNEEWYEGSTGSHEGMFPASFVEILIPLAQESQVSTNTGSGSGSGSYQVVAMYPFQAETSQDLSLQVQFSFLFSFDSKKKNLFECIDRLWISLHCRKVMF